MRLRSGLCLGIACLAWGCISPKDDVPLRAPAQAGMCVAPSGAAMVSAAASTLPQLPQGEVFRLLSFNIRFDTVWDGGDSWRFRKQRVADQIGRHADLAGLQEVLPHQLAELMSMLPGYSWIGVGRDDGMARGEFAPIVFRADRFCLVEGGHFWLSETPDQPGSLGWDSSTPRVVTWGRFFDRGSASPILLFNVHFDHLGWQAREEGAKLLTNRIASLARPGEAVLVTGDFNSGPDSFPYAHLASHLRDSRRVSKTPPRGPEDTFVGFRPQYWPWRERIDYIFVGSGLSVTRYEAVFEPHRGRNSSDHLPVVAEIHRR